MIRKLIRRAVSAVAACALCVLPASAAIVYRTVDDNGVVNFSDVRPEGEGAVEELEIDAPAPQPDSAQQQRLEDMRETTDRMVADRRAREKHRAEMRELQARSQPTVITEYRDEPDYYTPAYRGYFPHRPLHPGFRPRPDHPGLRPPLRPSPHAGRDPGPPLRTLPSYNDYPASLIRRNYDPRVREAFSTPRQ